MIPYSSRGRGNRWTTAFARQAWLGLLSFTPSCETAGRPGAQILVAAAASLSAVLPELVTAFEEESGVHVAVTTGASGQLAQQIREGAPVDVFLSADRAWVERLAAEQRIVAGTVAVYALGRLVLFQTAESRRIRAIGDLTDPRLRRIAIANPETAPYGRAARQALEAAGILAAVEARIVIAENVRQTVQYIETSGVDVAFTAEALMQPGKGTWIVVPAELYDPIEQGLGVVANRPTESAARAFAAFVLGPRGRDILARSGFGSPERTGS